jgi:hypothetical protein
MKVSSLKERNTDLIFPLNSDSKNGRMRQNLLLLSSSSSSSSSFALITMPPHDDKARKYEIALSIKPHMVV